MSRWFRWISVLTLILAASAPARAASLGELFQKAKAEVSAARYADALKTLEELKAESARPENEKFRSQLAPALAFYRGASLAGLGREAEAQAEFERYLELQPQATIETSAYPKKVVAAFEAAKKSREKGSSGSTSSLAAGYRDFRAPAPAEEADARWSQGAVQYLLASGDRDAFAALSDAEARRRFVEEFWRSRDPNPSTPENEFRIEFQRRVAFADTRFGDGEKPGSLTDRGMVFILLGPPTYAGRKPLTGEDASAPTLGGEGLLSHRLSEGARVPERTALEGDANWREVWHYRQELLPAGAPYQQVDVEFVTKKGYGKNVLQRDPATLSTLAAAKKAVSPRS